MAIGRSAWTTRGKPNGSTHYERLKDKVRDGTIPNGLNAEETSWHQCVHSGVFGIQQMLYTNNYFGSDLVTGLFGWRTKAAVSAYQADQKISADGEVGPQTMSKILHPVIKRTAEQHDFHPKWIWGLARQESALDPAAQGSATPGDMGVWQFNTVTGPLTPDEAFNIPFAALAVSKRFKAAMNRYAGKSHRLQVDCAIMQHRSPVAADFLYEHGESYGPESKAYVLSVRGFANTWDE